MACLILRSCTTGDNTIIVTNGVQSPTLVNYVGYHVPISGYTGCFSVEQSNLDQCPCVLTQQTEVTIDKVTIGVAKNLTAQDLCNCTVPYTCYILTPCDPALPTFYTEQNLNPYVGQTITFFGQGGTCYTVAGSITIPSGISAIGVECIDSCQCTLPDCGCPDGFILNDNGLCEGILNIDPVINSTIYEVEAANFNDQAFSIFGAQFYEDITNKPWPILASVGPDPNPPPYNLPWSTYFDNNMVPLIITNTVANSIWGGAGSSLTWRMRVAGVWTDAPPINFDEQPVNEWIGFSYCFTLTETKTYYVAYAVDDFVRIFLDGTLMINQDVTGWAFRKLQIFPITLAAGFHILSGEVKTIGQSAIFAFEIYDAPLAQLLAATTPADLNIVFSTEEKIGQTWQTGQFSGYTCPDGYSLNTCDGLVCSQITTVPQSPCFAWQITFCDGTGLDPIITSTDLTQYIGGVYSISYSIPAEPTPILVTACGTVEQAPAQVAAAFSGTFSEIVYDCCESCMAICYLLKDCQEAVPDIILCTDLSQYVGKIIKIKGCGNICWEVFTSDTCINSVNFNGEVTEFDTCEECLPPAPEPVPLVLHPRRIKPGYFSKNSCITTEYMERVNCNFAKQVYDSMLIKRYGITVCCDHDVDAWDIKKQVLDFELLTDPTLCKSTICYCLAPCFVSASITVTPICLAPALIDATLDKLCYAPTFIDAEVVANTTLINCKCYSIVGSNYKLSWIDCCCEYKSQVFELNALICAQYLPVITEGSADITEIDNCGSNLCTVPEPTCNCYQVTPSKGGALVYYTSCSGANVIAESFENPFKICSQTAPVPDPITSPAISLFGTCLDDCGATLNCKCYTISVTSNNEEIASVQIETIDCESENPNILTITSSDGAIYNCSKHFPVVVSSTSNSTISIVVRGDLNCLDGECIAPL